MTSLETNHSATGVSSASFGLAVRSGAIPGTRIDRGGESLAGVPCGVRIDVDLNAAPLFWVGRNGARMGRLDARSVLVRASYFDRVRDR